MVAIIADDFTGAAEVAGICMRQGVSVSLMLDIPDVESIQKVKSDVLVLAEDTRSATMEGAQKVSRLLAENLLAAGVTQVVKKIDSVMRGWVLAEMNVIAEVLGKKTLLIQPANTDTNRSIRNGLYYVGDTLLAETAFKEDPEFPAKTSSVKELLQIRNASATSSKPYLIPDAQDNADLQESVNLCHEDVLPGGSAAFWKVYLADLVASGKIASHTVTPSLPEPFVLQDSLVITGSAHQNSRTTSAQMAQRGFPMIEMPDILCQEAKPHDLDIIAWVNACVEAWEREHRLWIRISPNLVTFPSCAERLRYRMTEAVYYILQQIHPSQILIEGGATACSILARIGWSSFTPVKEWAPGVVQIQLNTPPHCYITLKPGSYTWPEFKI